MKQKLYGMISSVLSFVLPSISFSASGEVESKNARASYQLIVLGDSISAGMLAYTQVSNPRGHGFSAQSADDFDEPVPPVTWNDVRIPAVAESKSGWSWATGREIDSLASRLRSWLGRLDPSRPVRLRWINLSESGAVTSHIPRQARLAYEMSRSEPDAPIALVTLMIGANDACDLQDTSEAERARLRRNLDVTFMRLAKGARPGRGQGEPIPVFVSSVPNIPDLGRPEVLKHRAFLGLTCEKIRDEIIEVCSSLVRWKTRDEYRQRVDRVRFVNDVLRSAVRDARAKYPELSLKFDATFANYPLAPHHLAADCFHPGRRGHKELSEVLWNAMPWFRSPAPAR